MESTEVTIWSRFSREIYEKCLDAGYSPTVELYTPLRDYLGVPKEISEWPDIERMDPINIYPFLSTLIMLATLKKATPRLLKVQNISLFALNFILSIILGCWLGRQAKIATTRMARFRSSTYSSTGISSVQK